MKFNSSKLKRQVCWVASLSLLTFQGTFLLAATPQELLHQLNNSRTKSAAMEQLWRSGDPSVIKPLFETIARDLGIDLEPREEASSFDLRGCSCLGNMFRMRKSPDVEREINEGVLRMVDSYRRAETPRKEKPLIVACLGRIRSPAALPLLHELIDDKTRDDRLFMAIGEIDSPESVPILKTLVDSSRPRVHTAAIRALAAMKSSAARKTLKEICAEPLGAVCDKHPDSKVRKHIKEVLEREEKSLLRRKEMENKRSQHR